MRAALGACPPSKAACQLRPACCPERYAVVGGAGRGRRTSRRGRRPGPCRRSWLGVVLGVIRRGATSGVTTLGGPKWPSSIQLEQLSLGSAGGRVPPLEHAPPPGSWRSWGFVRRRRAPFEGARRRGREGRARTRKADSGQGTGTRTTEARAERGGRRGGWGRGGEDHVCFSEQRTRRGDIRSSRETTKKKGNKTNANTKHNKTSSTYFTPANPFLPSPSCFLYYHLFYLSCNHERSTVETTGL